MCDMMSKAYLTCLRDAHERLRSAMFFPPLLPLLHSDPPARLAPPSPLAPLRSDVAVKFGSNSGFLGGEIREKMDSMTQSAQISSSQGFADGQNSAAKESKLSDSFLSTSPVSLIQSPQDKKVVVGTDKPSESVTTSLRFPSQPGSFSASSYGSEAVEGQPDSPIKTSPVSERIKALEALAAKKREPEYRDFRDRHHEKSSSDVPKLPPSVTKPTIDISKPSANIPKPSVDKSKPPTDIPKLSFDTPRPTMDISKPPSDLPKLPADGPVCSTQKVGPGVCKMEGYPAEESPESPFEVLGELRQGSEYEETEEWMKAHLPPVLDIDAAESNKSTSSVLLKDPNHYPEAPAAFASVPDAFMDSPVKSPKLGNELIESQKQPESEEEFDISFLPVAYMCGQQEKANVQDSSNVESVTLPSDAAPAGLDSPSPSVPPSDSHSDAEQKAVDEKDTSWGEDLDRPVLSEADSSGESEDTVIEEGVGAPDSALQQSVNPPDLNDPPTASDLCSSEKVVPPPKSERKLMQVPTINVIETDEPNYSDEEMENEPQLTDDDDLEIIDDSNNPRASEPEPQSQDVGPPKTRPLETEFIEGYSPPSSPVDSDAEYSPKHNLPESISEGDPQQSVFKSEVQAEALEKALAGERAQTEKSESMSNTVQNAVMHDDVDFPDNNDEWSDEGQDSDLKLREESLSSQGSAFLNQFKVDEQSGTLGPEPCKERADVSMTSFMQDDIYDRQSFDYENDEPSPLDYSDGKELDKVKKQVLLDPAQEVEEEMPDLESDASFNDDEVLNNPADHASLDEYPQNPYSCFHNQTLSSAIEKNTGGNDKLPSLQQGSEIQPDLSSHANVQDQERISGKLDSESSFSEPPNSFVEFMRECLKSRQDEEPDEGLHSISSENELSKAVLPSSQSPPGVVMDLDQERITAGALNELGSNHDETPLNLQTKLTDRSEVDGGATSAQPSPFPSVRPSACSQSRSEFDNSYSKEVEAVDEWMAEAYYLAEHILTTILTHLSVKDLIHWRDPKKSGVVFGLSLLMLLSLAAFSVISVASYLLLALLIVTISFRIYKSVLQAVQKSNDGHPFKMLINKDVSIPPETFRKHVDASLTYINRGLKQMSRLFLVEDLVDSLKLAVVMWLLTYVGAVFNGITLLILADILLFAVPPVYEKNKTQIDQYIDVVRTQVNATVAKLQEKLPGAVKRSKTE